LINCTLYVDSNYGSVQTETHRCSHRPANFMVQIFLSTKFCKRDCDAPVHSVNTRGFLLCAFSLRTVQKKVNRDTVSDRRCISITPLQPIKLSQFSYMGWGLILLEVLQREIGPLLLTAGCSHMSGH